jgi:arylsulfatase A-like enzyme
MDSKSITAKKTWQSFYFCAAYGAIAWTVYAIIESLFLILLPWLIKAGYLYRPYHWGFTALLFVIYPAVGFILGGLSGLSLRVFEGGIPSIKKVPPTILFSVISIFTVILSFDINLIHNRTSDTSVLHLLFLLSISFLLMVGLLAITLSSVWFTKLRFFANPWTINIVLIGLPWLTLEYLSSSSREAILSFSLNYLAAVFLFSYFVQKIIPALQIGRTSTSEFVSPAKYLLKLVPIVFIVLGIIFFLHQKPIVSAPESRSSLIKEDLPNVILLTMDTVRADHLSIYGYERETSPNLKQLSQESTLYKWAIASGDMTLPTHASIFTGMYARQHGSHFSKIFPSGKPLSNKLLTIAEILSERGYLTMGVVANKGYLSRHFGMDQGFQYYDVRLPVPFLASTPPFYLRRSIRDALTHFVPRSLYDMTTRRAEEINREVFSLLNKLQEYDKPFFLFINYMDAHNPYIPPPPFDELYPGKNESFTSTDYYKLYDSVMALERKPTSKEYNHLISQYDGGIAYIDFNIGKLIERLKELGLYDNSLIIITSDHGEVFGERDLFNHAVSVYQDQIYIPLIIKYPHVNEGSIVNNTVSVVDLMPTIVDVLGHKVPGDIQGQSLFQPEYRNSKVIISESFPSGDMLKRHTRFNRIERAIFSGPYKFISTTAGKKELYNLLEDPNEENNLYNMEDSIAIELESKLNKWIKETAVESESTKTVLGKDAIERLKALGYVH